MTRSSTFVLLKPNLPKKDAKKYDEKIVDASIILGFGVGLAISRGLALLPERRHLPRLGSLGSSVQVVRLPVSGVDAVRVGCHSRPAGFAPILQGTEQMVLERRKLGARQGKGH
jgi:hypothetical protein